MSRIKEAKKKPPVLTSKLGQQKMRSIDVQKPLINPWLAAN